MVARIEQIVKLVTNLQIHRALAGTQPKANQTPFEYKNKVQCTVCTKFGHCITKGQLCNFAAQHQAVCDYIDQNGPEGMRLIRQNQEKFKAFNQPRVVNKIVASNNFPGVFTAMEHDDAVEERCEETAEMFFPNAFELE